MMTITAEKLVNIFCKISVLNRELVQAYLHKLSTSEFRFY